MQKAAGSYSLVVRMLSKAYWRGSSLAKPLSKVSAAALFLRRARASSSNASK